MKRLRRLVGAPTSKERRMLNPYWVQGRTLTIVGECRKYLNQKCEIRAREKSKAQTNYHLETESGLLLTKNKTARNYFRAVLF